MHRNRPPWLVLLTAFLALLLWGGHHTAYRITKAELSKRFPAAKTGLRQLSLTLSRLTLHEFFIEEPGWRIEGTISVDWRTNQLYSASLRASFFQSGNLEISNIQLLLPAPHKPGSVSIDKIRYKKLIIQDIRGLAHHENGTLSIEPFGATSPYGSFSGIFVAKMDEAFPYHLNLEVSRLHTRPILHVLELDSKVSLSGLFTGNVLITGNRHQATLIEGRLNAEPPGGDLDITDKQILSDMAERTKQPRELIESGFSRYHFNKGTLAASTQNRDLWFELMLEGPSGKRRFEPVIHDFFKKENE